MGAWQGPRAYRHVFPANASFLQCSWMFNPLKMGSAASPIALLLPQALPWFWLLQWMPALTGPAVCSTTAIWGEGTEPHRGVFKNLIEKKAFS